VRLPGAEIGEFFQRVFFDVWLGPKILQH
jgi:hypothetical protein